MAVPHGHRGARAGQIVATIAVVGYRAARTIVYRCSGPIFAKYGFAAIGVLNHRTTGAVSTIFAISTVCTIGAIGSVLTIRSICACTPPQVDALVTFAGAELELLIGKHIEKLPNLGAIAGR